MEQIYQTQGIKKNKTQNILVLGRDFVQKLNDTPIYAENMYSPNFSAENKIFALSLHYNGDNSHLFVNSKKITQFKAKNSKIKAYQLALGTISAFPNLSNSDIKDNKLYGNVYGFSVDYSTITKDKIDIHKYLMENII